MFNTFTRTFIVCILAMLVTGGISTADQGEPGRAGFGRYPAPSPDGTVIAFSWAGAIWTAPIDGGAAARLTVSDGYDYRPIWSPDGSKIAFISSRSGSFDVYVINARGGTPERITFASGSDALSGWLPSGDGLVFSSRRGDEWPDKYAPHVVMLKDRRGYGPSAPTRLVPCPGAGAVMHPDGDLVAFEIGPGNGFRQTYEGTHKKDIWIYEISTGQFTKIVENDFGNTNPQWSADGRTLYFRSEQDGIGNMWRWDIETSESSRVTNFGDVSMWNPRIGGPDGREVVAFEWKGGIYIQRIPVGVPEEIEITAWLDEDPHEPVNITATSGATEYTISPDGKEMAFVYRGEIYCVRSDGVGGTDAARLTDHPARDWEISWYPRGDAILFTSDRSGNEQLYRILSEDADHERLSDSRRFRIERLTHTDVPCQEAVITGPIDGDDESLIPANQTIAFSRNHIEFCLMNGDGEEDRKIFSYWGNSDYTFSPDGRWIAVSREDNDYNSDIYIMAVDPRDDDIPECPRDGWEPFPGVPMLRSMRIEWAHGWINITRHPVDDFHPVWSPDGSKLGFTSQRNWDNIDAYFVFLKNEDDERSYREWDVEDDPLPGLPAYPENEEPVEDETDDEDDEQIEDELSVVEIDFEGIHQRSRRLTSLEGNEQFQGFSSDGETIVYISDSGGTRDIWRVNWRGEEAKKIAGNAEPSNVLWNTGDDRIYYLSNGRITSITPDGDDRKSIGFRAEFSIDPVIEREFKFNEIWRLQNRWFYDSEFHGRDWDALRDEYEPLAKAAIDAWDFDDAVNMMLGRLNSSHLWYSDVQAGLSGPETGYLGCTFVEDKDPGIVVGRITPDTPISRLEFDIEPGDRIVSIKGIGVGGWGDNPVGNWWRTMEGTYNTEIEIGVIDGDDPANPRWVRITPANYSGWFLADYENCVKVNQEIVDKQTDGRLGYMHIRKMYEGPLERFEQDLYTVGHGRDGLVIDVRYNSGGWVTDWLLTMLNPNRHALTQPRDGGFGYPEDRTPVYETNIPIVVLCNEYSFSNAEIFAHAIQRLKRGTLIGWPTGGGVISTGGMRLADNSYLSIPRRGWWAINPATGRKLFNLEGTPAIPDVLVPFLPVNFACEDDPQLDAGIFTLLNELGLESR